MSTNVANDSLRERMEARQQELFKRQVTAIVAWVNTFVARRNLKAQDLVGRWRGCCMLISSLFLWCLSLAAILILGKRLLRWRIVDQPSRGTAFTNSCISRAEGRLHLLLFQGICAYSYALCFAAFISCHPRSLQEIGRVQASVS